MNDYVEFVRILESIEEDLENKKPLKALRDTIDAIKKYKLIIELFEEAERDQYEKSE